MDSRLWSDGGDVYQSSVNESPGRANQRHYNIDSTLSRRRQRQPRYQQATDAVSSQPYNTVPMTDSGVTRLRDHWSSPSAAATYDRQAEQNVWMSRQMPDSTGDHRRRHNVDDLLRQSAGHTEQQQQHHHQQQQHQRRRLQDDVHQRPSRPRPFLVDDDVSERLRAKIRQENLALLKEAKTRNDNLLLLKEAIIFAAASKLARSTSARTACRPINVQQQPRTAVSNENFDVDDDDDDEDLMRYSEQQTNDDSSPLDGNHTYPSRYRRADDRDVGGASRGESRIKTLPECHRSVEPVSHNDQVRHGSVTDRRHLRDQVDNDAVQQSGGSTVNSPTVSNEPDVGDDTMPWIHQKDAGRKQTDVVKPPSGKTTTSTKKLDRQDSDGVERTGECKRDMASSKIAFIKTLLTRQRTPSPHRHRSNLQNDAAISGRSPSAKKLGAGVAHPFREYFRNLMTTGSGKERTQNKVAAADSVTSTGSAEVKSPESGMATEISNQIGETSDLTKTGDPGDITVSSPVSSESNPEKDLVVDPSSSDGSDKPAQVLPSSSPASSRSSTTAHGRHDVIDDLPPTSPAAGTGAAQGQTAIRRDRSPANPWKSTSELHRPVTSSSPSSASPLTNCSDRQHPVVKTNSLQHLASTGSPKTPSTTRQTSHSSKSPFFVSRNSCIRRDSSTSGADDDDDDDPRLPVVSPSSSLRPCYLERPRPSLGTTIHRRDSRRHPLTDDSSIDLDDDMISLSPSSPGPGGRQVFHWRHSETDDRERGQDRRSFCSDVSTDENQLMATENVFDELIKSTAAAGADDLTELYTQKKFERQLEEKIADIEKERSEMISQMWKEFEQKCDIDATGTGSPAGNTDCKPETTDSSWLEKEMSATLRHRQQIDRSLDELLNELTMTSQPTSLDRNTRMQPSNGVRMRPRAASCNRKSAADDRRRKELALLSGKSRSHTQLNRSPSMKYGGKMLSHAGGMSVDAGLESLETTPSGRPLTCYLPVRDNSIDLRRFVETSGHSLAQCTQVQVTSTTCHGYLSKLQSGKLRSWKRRWFVFDRTRRCLFYYSDKSERRADSGTIEFQTILDVYVDHLRLAKSARPDSTFCVKTSDRALYLMAPTPEAMRIWIDVIFTGAEGYQQFV